MARARGNSTDTFPPNSAACFVGGIAPPGWETMPVMHDLLTTSMTSAIPFQPFHASHSSSSSADQLHSVNRDHTVESARSKPVGGSPLLSAPPPMIASSFPGWLKLYVYDNQL